MSRFIQILYLLTVVLTFGCQKKQPPVRIALAEGSLSVKNRSDSDIFPTVKTRRVEYFGVVSNGGGKTIGFAQIDADKQARVEWAEKEFDQPKQTVTFPLKISEEISKKTKHLEFLYKGKGVWLLNLYSSSPPGETKPLASIGGEIVKEEVR